MTLTKDEWQKVALSGMLLIGLIYCYFQFLLGPLDRKKAVALAKTADLDKKSRVAGATVREYRELLQKVDTAEETLLQIKAMVPEGAAIAWFPPKVRSFLDQHGIINVDIVPGGATPLEGSSIFRKMTFAVKIPQVDAIKFGIALAGFENQFPLVRVSQLNIVPTDNDPMQQQVEFTCITICKE